jgi:hypothetical protein
MKSIGSIFAHGGNFTSLIFSPVACCTPKSRSAEFSRNLIWKDTFGAQFEKLLKVYILRAGEKFWN